MNSKYQEACASDFKAMFPELHFFDEVPINGHRVDLATVDYRYGIEVKSSTVDLKSGYGLNCKGIAYPYVLLPERYAPQAIGWLYWLGKHRMGVICDTDDGYYMLKPARPDPHTCSVFEMISGCCDEIANKFYEKNAIKKWEDKE